MDPVPQRSEQAAAGLTCWCRFVKAYLRTQLRFVANPAKGHGKAGVAARGPHGARGLRGGRGAPAGVCLTPRGSIDSNTVWI